MNTLVKTMYEDDCAKLYAKIDSLTESEKQEFLTYLKASKKLMEDIMSDEDFAWEELPKVSDKAMEAFDELNSITIAWKMSDQDILDLDDKIIEYTEKA